MLSSDTHFDFFPVISVLSEKPSSCCADLRFGPTFDRDHIWIVLNSEDRGGEGCGPYPLESSLVWMEKLSAARSTNSTWLVCVFSSA